MSKVSDQQEDLLTDYGTATTAYLLMAMSIDSLERRNKQLEDESAKLRKLVRDMYAVMVEDAANCDVTYPEQFDDRMRGLGMEVDG